MLIAATSVDPAGGVGVLAAIAAGVVSFLSPCVLPLVPGYLSAVVGVARSELQRAGKRRVLIPSLLFVS
jgi:cytochrome c-type biogenesis protein